MEREKIISANERVIKKLKIRTLDIDKTTVLRLCLLFVFPILLLASINLYLEINLTEISRHNYSNNKSIEKVEKEIDSMKLELISLNNLMNIQADAGNLGFIFNEKINYIK